MIFVRHGGTFVRVSPNRLIKAGDEFTQETSQREDNVTTDIDSSGKPIYVVKETILRILTISMM